MWAIRPKPQLSLSRDLSYNISVNLPRLCGIPIWTVAHGHTKSMATGFACHTLTSHSPSLSFSHRSNKFEDLLQRESQLLHKYDEQAAHPESFQRISTLSGIHTQVKWQSYLCKNVL
ncbi:hypothetical protein CXH12_13850 [Citrobacter portucalensis]|nr:hypothetical protein C2U43_03005 [Citrobacter freundii complex sp. CFNIH9]PKQ48820.1 hypothetical protein CXH12_13850 [Citrobacter portucalensis]